jgi:cytochrome c-type biogenesis protein CcmH/NrfG
MGLVATIVTVAATGLLAIVLAWATHARIDLYRSRPALWGDTVAKVPENPRAWVCLGRALLDAGNSEAAERAIAEALRLAPDSCDAILQLGNAVRDRDPAGALALYRRAVAADPRNLAARTNLAAMLGMRGDPEAEAHLRAVLAEDAWNVEALSNYGSLCLTRGDVPAARQWFGRAAALAPGDPIVRRNLEIVIAAEAAAARPATPQSQSPP